MTSIAEPTGGSRPLAGVRIALTAVLLLVALAGTPWPWALLWVLVPGAAAGGLLLAWRFGRPALVFPLALLLAAFALTAALGGNVAPLWLTLWTPLGAAVGAWMGLREEGGGPDIGERAWMLAPMLLFAALLPTLPGFHAAIARLDLRVAAQQQRLMATPEMAKAPPAMREVFSQSQHMPAAERQREYTVVVPNLMFLWCALLVTAGRMLAARGAVLLGWPALSRSPLHRWRLPDAALVPLLVGIALLVFADRALHPGAWTLLTHATLGYSVQGVAVVESVLLSRGLPPAVVALSVLFVLAVSLLWVLPAVAVVGLSDVWLDYRRLEHSPAGEA